MIVEAQIPVNANKQKIWATITDIMSAEKILSGVEKIEVLNQPANGLVGLKWRETRMYFGKPAAVDKWITEAVENEFFKTRSEMDGFIFLTIMAISENGESILLTSSHETRSQSFAAKVKSLPMIFFPGRVKKSNPPRLERY